VYRLNVLLYESLGGGRVSALVAVERAVLEVHGVHVYVQVDLLAEAALADLAAERALLLVDELNVLGEAGLARALVLAYVTPTKGKDRRLKIKSLYQSSCGKSIV
jgi:hypothetical protein